MAMAMSGLVAAAGVMIVIFVVIVAFVMTVVRTADTAAAITSWVTVITTGVIGVMVSGAGSSIAMMHRMTRAAPDKVNCLVCVRLVILITCQCHSLAFLLFPFFCLLACLARVCHSCTLHAACSALTTCRSCAVSS